MIQFKFDSLGRLKLILCRLIKIHDYANCIITNEHFYFIIKNNNVIKLQITKIKGIINEDSIIGNLNIFQMYKSIKCIPATLDCIVEWNTHDYLHVCAVNIKNNLNYKSKIKVLHSNIDLSSSYFNKMLDTNIYANRYSKICLKSILWILEKFLIVNDTINLTFKNNKLLITTDIDDISGCSEIQIDNKNNIDESFINIKTTKVINILSNLEIFSNYAYIFINDDTLELCIYSHLESNIMIATLQ